MARSLEACSYKEQTAADNKVVAVKNLSAFFFLPLQLKMCCDRSCFFSFMARDKDLCVVLELSTFTTSLAGSFADECELSEQSS